MDYIKYFLYAFFISAAIIPILLILSKKLNLYDNTDIREFRKRKISRIGGAAVFISFMAISLSILPHYYNFKINIYIYLLSALMAFAIGFIDDIRQYTGKIKLLLQFICAGIAVYSGIMNENINLFGIVNIEFGFFAVIISLFKIVLLMNAINLIDGMDGIAAGILFTANIFLCILGFMSSNPAMISISLILCGSLAGFLIFNYPPAKIFLGDGGAYFLGFIFATLPMAPSNTAALPSISYIIPFVLIILPLTDLVYVALGRINAGRSFFYADKTHVHHRLNRLGLSNRKILCLITGFTTASGFASLLMYRAGHIFGLILLFSILLITGIFYYILNNSENKLGLFNNLNQQKDMALINPLTLLDARYEHEARQGDRIRARVQYN